MIRNSTKSIWATLLLLTYSTFYAVFPVWDVCLISVAVTMPCKSGPCQTNWQISDWLFRICRMLWKTRTANRLPVFWDRCKVWTLQFLLQRKVVWARQSSLRILWSVPMPMGLLFVFAMWPECHLKLPHIVRKVVLTVKMRQFSAFICFRVPMLWKWRTTWRRQWKKSVRTFLKEWVTRYLLIWLPIFRSLATRCIRHCSKHWFLWYW